MNFKELMARPLLNAEGQPTTTWHEDIQLIVHVGVTMGMTISSVDADRIRYTVETFANDQQPGVTDTLGYAIERAVEAWKAGF